MIEDTSRQIEEIHPSPNPPEPAQKHPRPSGVRTGAIIGLILLLSFVIQSLCIRTKQFEERRKHDESRCLAR
jgi:hypothetical protein